MKKIFFITSIGDYENSIPNGVNIKNKQILRYLKNNKDYKIQMLDTENWKKNFFPIFFKIIFYSFYMDNIILSINTNSAYYLIKFFSLFKLDKKLLYIVVGGGLPDNINNNNYKIKYYLGIKKIFVETKEMLDKLKKMDMKNVEILSNSKFLPKNLELTSEISKKQKSLLKLYYIGRINPEKGLRIITDTITKFNEKNIRVSVDFFGPIEENYKKEFFDHIKKNDYFRYNGILDFISNSENSYRTISQYDLFIFPTYWEGEGFPGVIIDAFIASTPVLASNFRYNSELVIQNENGLLFESQNEEDLIEKLEYILKNRDILENMRQKAKKTATLYDSKNVLKILDNYIV